MKIVFDHEIFYQQKYGGISSYFTNLGLELLKKNTDINFVCPIHKNNNLKKLPNNIILGKKIIYPAKINYFISKINDNLSNIFYKNLKPDIIHKTYFSKNRINSKYKNVITFYDITHELNKTSTIINENIKSLKKNNIKFADHIICPSNRVKIDLINYFNVNESKISVTYFSSDYKKNLKPELLKNKKMQNYLLYVGNRSGYKNFENLVTAYANSERLQKDFKILVFGGEKPSICGKELILKKKLPINSFKFVNGTNKDLEYFYKNVRAFIYTSTYEGFGIPLVEAMRSGCPIITSNGGALEEVGGSSLTYFDPFNVDEIQKKIEDLVYSDNKLIEATIYGLKRCDNFSWANCATKTLKVYEELYN
jgi:glycosyltransferase involved in cell wall biosynthesis